MTSMLKWHPAVREQVNHERLVLWKARSRGGYPRADVDAEAKSVLARLGLRSVLITELFGDFDLLLQTWLGQDEASRTASLRTNILRDLVRLEDCVPLNIVAMLAAPPWPAFAPFDKSLLKAARRLAPYVGIDSAAPHNDRRDDQTLLLSSGWVIEEQRWADDLRWFVELLPVPEQRTTGLAIDPHDFGLLMTEIEGLGPIRIEAYLGTGFAMAMVKVVSRTSSFYRDVEVMLSLLNPWAVERGIKVRSTVSASPIDYGWNDVSAPEGR